MASWTDQTPQVATEEDIHAPWNGGKDGKYFRCYLCGHRFAVGDIWRWAYTSFGNLIVCNQCDGSDVVGKWKSMHEEAQERFWWFTTRGRDGE